MVTGIHNLSGRYNASTTFIDANLEAGRGNKHAVLCGNRALTYNEIAAMMNQIANALLRIGVQMEQRIMILLPDCPEFAAGFFGCIRIGAVPIPVNTLLASADYEYLLNDSRAVALIVSVPLYAAIEPIRKNLKWLKHIIVTGNAPQDAIHFNEWIKNESKELAPAETSKDDPCFWLYSSGTTGFPKGAVHLQQDMAYCAENYGKQILNINENDRTFSVAKLFFAYGLGNALYFPFYVGATTILYPGRPHPKATYEVITKYKPTLVYAVPTAYSGLLAVEETSEYDLNSVRLCISAGEALPKAIFERWNTRWGIEILDGIGSTEVLHIYISNRPKELRAGSSGKIVPGYEAKIVDENDQQLAPGEVGNLLIRGESTCAYYWNQKEKTKQTIIGDWIRTGDKYSVDQDGYFWYQGRSDDMLKAGCIWVSPVEVESALMEHPVVLECAVIGCLDKDELIKPKAFVVLREGYTGSLELAEELKKHVKGKIAPYKYPRWIEFLDELPKTATGKIQRFKLRRREQL